MAPLGHLTAPPPPPPRPSPPAPGAPPPRPAPRPVGARDHRVIDERGMPPRERAALGVVDEAAGIPRPGDEPRGPAEAGLAGPGEERADRHDPDLLGDEQRAPRVGPREHEAAERPREPDGGARREPGEPAGAEPAPRHVGAHRDHPRPGAEAGSGGPSMRGSASTPRGVSFRTAPPRARHARALPAILSARRGAAGSP